MYNVNCSNGQPYYVGENIAASTNYRDPQGVVDMWMSETAWYHYATNSCDSGQECGHYTQIVWRDTLEVGCAITRCPAILSGQAGYFWVCDYGPGGNYVGQKPY